MEIDRIFIGIDVGSVSVNTVLMNEGGEIIEDWYTRHKGQPLRMVYDLLEKINTRIPIDRIANLAVTGSGGELVARLLCVNFVNEIIAQNKAVGRLYPEVKTVIEIGGEDSKLILLKYDESLKTTVISDFSMNTICAAGTGSFLDQQASRLGFSIEEFGRFALRSKNPPRIAGRCSVFAKTDMIHLQQKATPDYDIVAGLCYAMARNFKSNIGKGKKFQKPISFQGGVAANLGMVKAFESVLELAPGELIVPKYYASMGAIGAILITIEERGEIKLKEGMERLQDNFRNAGKTKGDGLQVLQTPSITALKSGVFQLHLPQAQGKKDAYLGIDVGSISTNLVVMDSHKNLLSKRYLMTKGKPIEAVQQGLEDIGSEVGEYVEIKGVCTTGSGRYLIGDLIGADVVKNEITAQARAAIEIDKNVDTIFEIGGQDSKYISLENGTIVDFEMNKVCAAGTGSFLEEQAEKLNINIKEVFGHLALSAQSPVRLGERCTVFMESDLVHHQQRGVDRDNLVAGLSYSVVYNYLNRVVGDKKIGEHIFFQGGVAYNKGVVAAFGNVLGKPITVPPHHEVTGAIGCALLARESGNSRSSFKGFGLSKANYKVSSFECNGCTNRCAINQVSMEGEQPLFYGSRCEKYEMNKHKKGDRLPDLFREREKFLLNSHPIPSGERRLLRERIGIPRILTFHELFPLWKTFFSELGFEVVFSERTNKKIIHQGLENVEVETCFPIKIAHGHVLDLLEKGVDYIFLPSIINMSQDNPNFDNSFTCPYVQTIPYVIKAAMELDAQGVKVIQPILYLKEGKKHLQEVLIKVGRGLNRKLTEIKRAIRIAQQAQDDFYRAIRKRGQEVLSSLREDEMAIVIVSRPYNGCDSGINMDLPKKLKDLGVLAIPMDYLPLDSLDISDEFPNMYWRYGQKILSAARIIRNDKRLYGLYITNFACGADSFIIKLFKDQMKDKPYLQIEIDEHSGDAGVITRCEAFLDSLKNGSRSYLPKVFGVHKRWLPSDIASRTLLIPYISDHAYPFAAAFVRHGVCAQVMSESNEETLFWGRKFTSGKECYPCIITTGNMVKVVKSPGFQPHKVAFFMPSGCGPCRFGQYNTLHRMILNELGYPDVPIYAPNQDKNIYGELSFAGGINFARSAWQGVVCCDVLDKALRETRPYEKNKGQTDGIYKKCIEDICKSILNGDKLPPVMEDALRAFEDIPIDRLVRKPIIGIVGEIFVRSNRFSNDNIILAIERLGGEVWMPPAAEWLLYGNYSFRFKSWLKRDYLSYINYLIKEKVQKYDEHRLQRPFHRFLKNLVEPEIREILENSKPYLHPSYEGEAVLSIGKSIDFAKKGLSGVVNVMPFTCMPGTIVTAILKMVRKDYDNIPCLTIAYDGLKQTKTQTRLEAFMYQTRQFIK